MAITALQSASSGLSALNTSLDVIANNLANVNTAGFKASRVNFQDLMYIEKAQPGVRNAFNDQRPIGLYVGLGVKASGTQQIFTQGSPIRSGNDLDALIEGQGFFRVLVPDGVSEDGYAYTRAGQFTLNADGDIVMASDQGRRLEPAITIPDNALRPITITADGRVLFQTAQDAAPQEAGQILLSDFINPSGLTQIGENLWVKSPASGDPIEGVPGEENFGQLLQNHYEASNVDPTNELVDLIRTQRAFEMNSQTIRAADEALQVVAQLRR